MGRKKQYGPGYDIHHAEELFEQSVERKKPDYRYVALAIGKSPVAPPDWAILACIQARQEEERKAASLTPDLVSPVLDDLVRFFAKEQWDFEDRMKKSKKPLPVFTPTPLRKALRLVLSGKERWKDHINGANDDWQAPFREAWRREQENDVLQSHFFQLDGFKTTSRIERVLCQLLGQEYDGPEDLEYTAWIAKRSIELNRV